VSRAAWTAFVAVAGVAAAVALALVGVAVLDVSGQARADDRLVANSGGRRDVEPHERDLGVRIGEAILGLADDRRYRDAVELAKSAALKGQPELVALELRAQAEAILAEVLRGDGGAELRSGAANLLGTLYFEDAKTQQNPRRYLQNALGAFQDAALLDPANRAAKENLELLATLPAHTSFGERSAPGASASASPDVPGGY
jgi:hypothetical protein